MKKKNGVNDLVDSPAEEDNGGKKLNIDQLKRLANKRAGVSVVFDLTEHDNPTEVTEWISTGAKVLDSIICRGSKGGIPVKKISCLAGLEGVGKSYLASIISKNAQAQGFTVVYFDTESAIDPGFLERIGCNIDKLIYIQPPTVEFTMETIEEFLKNGERFLFIIDSIAMLPTKAESEGDYNPQSTMAVKPRVLTKAFAKLVQPIAKSDSALLILNQLKTNISSNPFDMLTTPYFMPAGFALKYASSLTIWLTGRKAKDSFVTDTNGYRIGSSCKAKLEKSRFGTQFRECTFKILWGGDTIAIDETEAWLEIMKVSDLVEKRGHSYVVQTEAGEQVFKNDDFPEKLLDASFRKRVDEIVEDFLITRFDQRSGNAKNYYNLDGEDEAKEETGVE